MTEKLTRALGLRRLQEFLPRAGEIYTCGRNFVPGPNDAAPAVSQLSPFLQRRLLCEPEALAAVRAQHSDVAAQKFIQEILWRTYWKGWLEQRPSVWRSYCAAVATEGAAQIKGLAAAEKAQSGIACFDAWVQKLQQTGLLHNHERMWFASIWIFTLQLPWSLGAAFFYRHLLDGDAASNTLSWRWVAGLQTRGKTYLARSDNIAKYTRGQFSHTPDLATAAVPVAPEAAPPQIRLELTPLPEDWQGDRQGLLICPDDLSVEHGALGSGRFAAIAAVSARWQAQVHGWSPTVLQAGDEALEDAAGRAQAHYGQPVTTLFPTTAQPSLHEALFAWVQAYRLECVVMVRPFIGPWEDALAPFFAAAQKRGLQVLTMRREHDRQFFPAATHGYFRFKKRLSL